MSPLLASVCPYCVLDLRAGWRRNRHARGEVIIVRFADDFIAGFEYREDAERFLDGCAAGSRSPGWSCTRTRPGRSSSGAACRPSPASRALGKPETFGFLGFTHTCAIAHAGICAGAARMGDPHRDYNLPFNLCGLVSLVVLVLPGVSL